MELDCLPAEVKQAARPDKEACWPRSCGRAPELAVGLMKVLSPIALLVVALACARGELLTFREQVSVSALLQRPAGSVRQATDPACCSAL